jgi:hypothetical protein
VGSGGGTAGRAVSGGVGGVPMEVMVAVKWAEFAGADWSVNAWPQLRQK